MENTDNRSETHCDFSEGKRRWFCFHALFCSSPPSSCWEKTGTCFILNTATGKMRHEISATGQGLLNKAEVVLAKSSALQTESSRKDSLLGGSANWQTYGWTQLDLKLGLANYTLWAKSSPLPVFVNKVLLGNSHAHLFMFCQWVPPGCHIFSGDIRTSGSKSLKYLLSHPLHKRKCLSIFDLENSLCPDFVLFPKIKNIQVPVPVPIISLNGRSFSFFN